MRRITTKITLVATAAALAGCVRPTVQQQAASLARRHREDDAVKLLSRHLVESPDDLDARALLVKVRALASDARGARVEATELALRVPEGDPRAWIALGNALEIEHEFEQALFAYDVAASVAPASAKGPHEGGMRAAHWGEVEMAIPRLEEATRRDPRDLDAWHALGLARLSTGDSAGADAAYRACLAVDRARADCWLGLATVAIARDDAATALAAYDALATLDASASSYELGRAWALTTLGRKDDARRAVARAEELGADPRMVARARARLGD